MLVNKFCPYIFLLHRIWNVYQIFRQQRHYYPGYYLLERIFKKFYSEKLNLVVISVLSVVTNNDDRMLGRHVLLWSFFFPFIYILFLRALFPTNILFTKKNYKIRSEIYPLIIMTSSVIQERSFKIRMNSSLRLQKLSKYTLALRITAPCHHTSLFRHKEHALRVILKHILTRNFDLFKLH